MSEALRIGLVGAGPWAQLFTGPMLQQSPDAEFVGVWARRTDAAESIASTFSTTAFSDLDALIDACDALCFSLPPSVQAELAARAARAGKSVLLDKPVGANVDEAAALAEAIGEAGVASAVIFTNRYFDVMREFLSAAASFEAYGGRASFFGNGCVPGTYFATPWRLSEGGLLDLGPHVLDALDASLGTIVGISAKGDVHGLVLLECEHENGRISQAALSATTDQAGGLAVELHGPAGALSLDLGNRGDSLAQEIRVVQDRIVAELAHATRTGEAHPLDVHRGLHIQRLIDDAADQLRDA